MFLYAVRTGHYLHKKPEGRHGLSRNHVCSHNVSKSNHKAKISETMSKPNVFSKNSTKPKPALFIETKWGEAQTSSKVSAILLCK